MGVLLLFVDGVGMGEPDPDKNPLFRARLRRLRLGRGLPAPDPAGLLVTTDACMGVPGLPQSATGQTSILAGVNARAVVPRTLVRVPDPSLVNPVSPVILPPRLSKE